MFRDLKPMILGHLCYVRSAGCEAYIFFKSIDAPILESPVRLDESLVFV